jgi:hemin uptake protein HemP
MLRLLTLSLNCNKCRRCDWVATVTGANSAARLKETQCEVAPIMDSRPALPDARPQEPDDQSLSPRADAKRTLDSADLFQGARQVQIRHDEKIYRLQVTRNGKLILIK